MRVYLNWREHFKVASFDLSLLSEQDLEECFLLTRNIGKVRILIGYRENYRR